MSRFERRPTPAVRLAPDIAEQFRHHPPATAAEEIVGHIRQFWEPRMRRALVAELERETDLDPLVRRVASRLRER